MNQNIYSVTFTAFAAGRTGAAYSLDSRDLPDDKRHALHADPTPVVQTLLSLPDIDRVQVDINLDDDEDAGEDDDPAPAAPGEMCKCGHTRGRHGITGFCFAWISSDTSCCPCNRFEANE